jgi:hypothetical protein
MTGALARLSLDPLHYLIEPRGSAAPRFTTNATERRPTGFAELTPSESGVLTGGCPFTIFHRARSEGNSPKAADAATDRETGRRNAIWTTVVPIVADRLSNSFRMRFPSTPFTRSPRNKAASLSPRRLLSLELQICALEGADHRNHEPIMRLIGVRASVWLG